MQPFFTNHLPLSTNSPRTQRPGKRRRAGRCSRSGSHRGSHSSKRSSSTGTPNAPPKLMDLLTCNSNTHQQALPVGHPTPLCHIAIAHRFDSLIPDYSGTIYHHRYHIVPMVRYCCTHLSPSPSHTETPCPIHPFAWRYIHRYCNCLYNYSCHHAIYNNTMFPQYSPANSHPHPMSPPAHHLSAIMFHLNWGYRFHQPG